MSASLIWTLIIVLLMSRVADGRSQHLNDLEKNYSWLSDELMALIDIVEYQRTMINHQRAEMDQLKQDVSVLNGGGAVHVASVARTCQEIRSSFPSSSSQMYWIDPDGYGVGDAAIYVFCNMTTGATIISHDNERNTSVDECAELECFSRDVTYNASLSQIIQLADRSFSCSQSIQYECHNAPLSCWWDDRHGTEHFQLASDDQADADTCLCGIEANCVHPSVNCNCDSPTIDGTLTDMGRITDKDLLPVTRINFGAGSAPSSGSYTLAKLECYGRSSFEGIPKSCHDLRQAGHRSNGFYIVKASRQLEMIYCDMNHSFDEHNAYGYLWKSGSAYFQIHNDQAVTAAATAAAADQQTNDAPSWKSTRASSSSSIVFHASGQLDSDAGAYTVSVAGLYLVLVTGSNDSVMKVSVWKDDQQVASSSERHLSISHALQCQAGQVIRVQSAVDGVVAGVLPVGCYFTGVLLHEDL